MSTSDANRNNATSSFIVAALKIFRRYSFQQLLFIIAAIHLRSASPISLRYLSDRFRRRDILDGFIPRRTWSDLGQ